MKQFFTNLVHLCTKIVNNFSHVHLSETYIEEIIPSP